MIIILTISEKYFSLNGIPFAKIYQPLKQGLEDIGIYSIYDTRQQLQNSEKYDQFQINGTVYGTQAETITALLDVIFSAGLESQLNDLQNEVNNLTENQVTGVEVYETKVDEGGGLSFLPVTGTLLVSYKVANDPDNSVNGYYHWNGTVYVKDYDLVQSSNEVTVITFKNIFGTWINTPSSPIVSSTLPLDTTQSVNGAVTAVYYKGNVLDKTKFTGGTIVILNGVNVLDELCLVWLVYDKDSDAFHVNIQTGFTGDLPAVDVPDAPTSLVLTEGVSTTPNAPTVLTLTEGTI